MILGKLGIKIARTRHENCDSTVLFFGFHICPPPTHKKNLPTTKFSKLSDWGNIKSCLVALVNILHKGWSDFI